MMKFNISKAVGVGISIGVGVVVIGAILIGMT